jgi:hypothetical protein
MHQKNSWLGLAAGVLFLVASSAAQAIPVFSQTYQWTDPLSGGQVDITVDVDETGNSQDWKYTIDNLSFEPFPGQSNGLSGFNLVFAASVPELGGVFGPAGWINNCCGTPPPAGSEWDIRNSGGAGILVGSSDMFGFTTDRRDIVEVMGAPGTSWVHSWVMDGQVNTFQGDIAVPGQLNPIPEPSSVALFSVGFVLVGTVLNRRSH